VVKMLTIDTLYYQKDVGTKCVNITL